MSLNATGAKPAPRDSARNESDFELFFRHSPDLMIIVGFDGLVRRMNDAMGAAGYLKPDHVESQSAITFIHPEDRERFSSEFEALRAGGMTRSFEMRTLMQDGSYNWFLWSATGFPDREIFCATGHNITDRKLADDALAERVRQQAAVAELGNLALAGGDAQPLMNEAVAMIARVLGVGFVKILELAADRREFVVRAGVGWKAGLVGQGRISAGPETLCGFLLTQRTPLIVEDFSRETRFRGSDLLRDHAVVSGMGCMIAGPDRPIGVLAVFTANLRTFSLDDVHFLESMANVLAAAVARKRTEDELNRFFEPSLNPMLVGGFDGMMKRCNPATSLLTGYTEEEMRSRPLADFVHDDDRPAAVAEIQKLAAGETLREFEFRIVRQDGTCRWVVWNATSSPARQLFYAIGQDVTDRHAAAEQLAERARLATLTADVAQAITGEATIALMLQKCADAVMRHVGAALVRVWTLNAVKQVLELQASVGLSTPTDGEYARIPVGEYMIGDIARSRQTFVTNSVIDDPRARDQDWIRREGLVSYAGFPLLVEDQLIGGLVLLSREPLNSTVMAALTPLAGSIALGIQRRQVMEELRTNEEMLRVISESALDAVILMDPQAAVAHWNQAAETMFGYSRQEILGRKIHEILVPPEVRGRAHAGLAGFRRTGQGPAVGMVSELEAVHKDGHRFPVELSLAAVSLKGEWNAVGIVRDITARKQAEESLRLNVAAIEAAANGIAITDASGALEWVNPAFTALTGYTASEALGQNPSILKSGRQSPEFYEQLWSTITAGRVWHGELVNRRKDGSFYDEEMTITPVRDAAGAITHFIAIKQDITSRRQIEQSLELSRRELEKSKAEAETANRVKSEFLANMSHEIRTPMNGIIGLTGLVLDTDGLSAEQRQYLDGVLSSAESLLKIINDILDFSKIEAGRLELERTAFDLRETLGGAINTLSVRAREKGLDLLFEVRPDVPDALIGDPVRLWQLVINLVGNALKFTQVGEISVRVEIEERTADAVSLLFTISDTGIGIPAEKLAGLFQPFIQVDSSTTRKYGGTGLGLAISARLVQMMQGRIWCESELGKGSCFYFTVRLGVQTSPAPKRSPLPPSKLDGLPVLVVDDNATNRRILHDMLTHWGMQPSVAASGAGALAALQATSVRKRPFRLIVLDVMMPDMDGFQVLEKIQRLPLSERPLILMLSSADRPGDKARSRDLGAAAYLLKPIKPSDLLDAIMSAFSVSFEGGLPPAHRMTPPDRHPGTQLRILVAEDNPVNRLLAVRILEKAGHYVASAANGEEVLERLSRETFHLVLMDVQMPVMDGFEATALIRQQEKVTGRHLPIVAMTAHAMKGDREKCLEAGMDGYVSKPIQTSALFAAIAEAVALPEPAYASEKQDAPGPEAAETVPVIGGPAGSLSDGAGGAGASSESSTSVASRENGVETAGAAGKPVGPVTARE